MKQTAKKTAKGQTLLLPILLIVFLLFLLATLLLPMVSCDDNVFEVREMRIKLTDEFSESLRIAFTAAYESYDMAVLVIREDNKVVEEAAKAADIPLTQYAQMIIDNGDDLKGNTTIVEEEGLTTFTYTNTEDKIDYTYYATVFSSEEAYWLVQFVVKTEQFEAEKPNILTYAKSIHFDE